MRLSRSLSSLVGALDPFGDQLTVLPCKFSTALGANRDLRRAVATAPDPDLPGAAAHGAILDERVVFFARGDDDRPRLAAVGTENLDLVFHDPGLRSFFSPAENVPNRRGLYKGVTGDCTCILTGARRC